MSELQKPLIDLAHITGHHTLLSSYDLQRDRSAFTNTDVMPLDAPFFIPAGSHVKLRTNEGSKVFGSSAFRGIEL